MLRLRTRPASHDDLALTYAITEDAMRSYVEKTWGTWDERAQFEKHETNFTPETYRIILIGNEAAGLIAVEDFPTHLWLVKLYLFAGFRGQGIGSHMLREVLQAAAERGKTVTLRVLKVNKRAQSLYKRHGFKVTDEDAERLYMASGA